MIGENRGVVLGARRAVNAESVRPIPGKVTVWGTLKSTSIVRLRPDFLVADLATDVAGKEPDGLAVGGIRNGQIVHTHATAKAS